MINQKRLITTAQNLLKINSENPPGKEWAVSQWIARDMRSIGAEVKLFSFAPRRPNVIAILKGSWPREKAKREALLLSPHVDTVPIGTGWTKDPYGSQIIKDKLFGRGTSDDKGNLACSLEVLRSLLEDQVKLKRDIIMAATVDEECGSKLGIIPLLDKGILRPKAALILDADECNAIIAQKGLMHCRIQVFGKKAHGAYNWRGVNAIELAVKIIDKLKRHHFRFHKHPLLREPTMNVGTIKGGDKVNIVADFCEFSLDVRFLPGMKDREVLAEIKSIATTVTNRFKVIIDDLQQPYELAPEHPLVKTYLVSARTLKMKTTIKGSEGATVMTFFNKHKIPAFATGYGTAGTAHTTDEHANISTLHKGTQLLERFIKDYDDAN